MISVFLFHGLLCLRWRLDYLVNTEPWMSCTTQVSLLSWAIWGAKSTAQVCISCICIHKHTIHHGSGTHCCKAMVILFYLLVLWDSHQFKSWSSLFKQPSRLPFPKPHGFLLLLDPGGLGKKRFVGQAGLGSYGRNGHQPYSRGLYTHLHGFPKGHVELVDKLIGLSYLDHIWVFCWLQVVKIDSRWWIGLFCYIGLTFDTTTTTTTITRSNRLQNPSKTETHQGRVLHPADPHLITPRAGLRDWIETGGGNPGVGWRWLKGGGGTPQNGDLITSKCPKSAWGNIHDPETNIFSKAPENGWLEDD